MTTPKRVHGINWRQHDDTDDDLDALVDEIERLRIEVAELRRIVALERGDESAALPGWKWNPHARYWYSCDGWGIWRSQTASWSTWLGRIKRDYRDDCPIDRRTSRAFPTVWDAMHAATLEADHDYAEIALNRDDLPRPYKACAHCGRAKAYCQGRKP